MPLSPRDRIILRLADYFGQAGTAAIFALAFPDAKSKTSCDRTLRRLFDEGYLARVENRRGVGGVRGGSVEHVYYLGPEGWKLCKRDGRWHRRQRDYHALSILDAYLRLIDAQRAGALVLKGFQPEPEAWRQVAGVTLKPDIYLELERPNKNGTLKVWLEIDLGTERQARIAEKLDRYVAAFESGELDPFPRVVFVAHDDERATELQWMIERRPSTEPRLFKAVDLAGFATNI